MSIYSPPAILMVETTSRDRDYQRAGCLAARRHLGLRSESHHVAVSQLINSGVFDEDEMTELGSGLGDRTCLLRARSDARRCEVCILRTRYFGLQRDLKLGDRQVLAL